MLLDSWKWLEHWMRKKIWRILVCVLSPVHMFQPILIHPSIYHDWRSCLLSFWFVPNRKTLIDSSSWSQAGENAHNGCHLPLLWSYPDNCIRAQCQRSFPSTSREKGRKYKVSWMKVLFLIIKYWLVDDLMIPCFILVSFISQVEILS